MKHLGIILTILALMMGGMSLAHTIQLYRRLKLGYLRAHNVVFALLNFQIFAGLMLNYFQFNMEPAHSSTALRWVFRSYHLFLAIIGVWFAYCLVVMIFELVQWKLSRKWLQIYIASLSVTGLFQLYFLIFPRFIGKMPFYLIFLLIQIMITQLVSLGILVAVVRWALPLKDRIRRSSVLRFVSLILFLILTFMVLNSFQVPGKLSLDVYVLLISILFLGMNTLPLVFMKGFIYKNFKVVSIDLPDGEVLDEIFRKFKISAREIEIIRLICDGKSNKEIEDELYISLQTVKDHVYNIYQKTGIKNRVQLVNLFRSS